MKSLWTTFRYTFAGLRGQTLSWGIGLALYGLLLVPMYESMGADAAQFQKILTSYPPEFLAFFGASPDTMITPAGYLGMYAFSMMPLILGIFAIIAGSNLIVSDEENGRLDLIIAHPIGRKSFFWGRTLAIFVASLSIMIIGWLGFSILLGRSSLGLNWGQMTVPFLTLLVQVLIFITFALLLSLLLPSRNLAAMVSGVFVVSSYFISSLAFLDTRLETITKILPYHYYQTVMSYKELNLTWLFALLGISILLTLLAYILFSRRDIRLSGEGSWRRN